MSRVQVFLTEEKILENATKRHHLSFNLIQHNDLITLIRYARMIGVNEGILEASNENDDKGDV